MAHDLAYIAFEERDYGGCAALLAPRIEARTGATAPASQVLWLRALHRAGELERGLQWAAAAEQRGMLHPLAAGVASLLAVDGDDLPAARRWAGTALEATGGASMEALLARSTLALSDQDAGMARDAADAALQINGSDGRAWSARAFANMLAGDLLRAGEDFDRAVDHMPGHIGTWLGRGWALLLRGEVEAARASFEAALAIDRNFGESHGALAVVAATTGDREQAEQHLQRALRLDAAALSAHYAQAILAGRARDPELLQRLLQRALRASQAVGGTSSRTTMPSSSGRGAG